MLRCLGFDSLFSGSGSSSKDPAKGSTGLDIGFARKVKQNSLRQDVVNYEARPECVQQPTPGDQNTEVQIVPIPDPYAARSEILTLYYD